jgi:hypothetical protein
MKKKDLAPGCLKEEKQEGSGAIFWAFASIFLVGIAIICLIFSQFCH